MQDRALIATVGGPFAAICCATPLLAVLFETAGLAARLAQADYVLIPAMIPCCGLIGRWLYRRRGRQE